MVFFWTVPSPPRTLWGRLKFLEDHITRLEKDYPPWAALHFNQPNRGVSVWASMYQGDEPLILIA